MPKTSRPCPRCGAPIVYDDVSLCPACTMSKIFGFDEGGEILEVEDLLAGKFRLGEKLGEGGFGVVYRAEQIEPVQRNVAVKIIKRGMDSDEVIARFEAERQALALLDHPGIAKLHEAGTTAEGRPFFAMELVEGQPITDHCQVLTQCERLKLFGKVCDAVQHAHHRGIIHRDLKPSNILVSEDGGLKVIDFGIAKATTKLLTEKTLLTEFHQFVGTPAYVSPEQAAMTGKPVDVRSDLYSLGVLLYELLTGTPPFDDELFRKAGLGEILRVIREEEPQKPSTRITQKIECDLDWVVMCALEKDPDRRYSSAHEFASDVRRFLSNQPVEASSPSNLYRLQKFIHRNKGGVIAASVALISLIGGLILASYGLIRAQEEAKVARVQAGRANAVVRLMDEMFGSADPFLSGGSDYTVHQLLDDYSQEFEGQLNDQPEVELSLQRTLASAYQGLAEYASAERHFRRAHELSVGLDHSDRDALQRSIGWALRHQGHYQEAFEELEEVPGSEIFLVEVHRLLGQHDESLKLAQEIRPRIKDQRGLTILALAFVESGDFEMANLLAKKALNLAKKKYGEKSPKLIRPLDTLATIVEKQKRPKLVAEYTHAAREIAQTSLPENHPARLFAETRAAETALNEERKSLTSRLLEKVGDNPETFTPILKLIASLAAEGKSLDAQNFLTEKLGINYEDFSSGKPITIETAGEMVRQIMREGRVKNYIPLIEQALSVGAVVLGEENTHTIELKRLLAYMYRWDKRYSESEKLSREALAHCRQHLGETHGATVDVLLNFAKTLWDQDRDEEADFLLMGNLGHTRSDADTARVLENLGEIFLKKGRFLTAQKLLDRSLAIRRRVRGNEHPETFRVLTLLGDLEVSHRWIRQLARGPLLIEAYELSRKLHGDDAMETAHCVRRLTSDRAQLLGIKETLTLCEQALSRAVAAHAGSEVLPFLEQLLQERKRLNSNYEQRADNHLERFKTLKTAGKERSAESIEQLYQAAYAEIMQDNFMIGQKHLAQAKGLMSQIPDLDPNTKAGYANIVGWAYWRAGRRKEAADFSIKSFRELISAPGLSTSSQAYLLRNVHRSQWDYGDMNEFWKKIDQVEDELADLPWDSQRTSVIFSRASRWFHYGGPEAPHHTWKTAAFSRELLWARSHAPFTDFAIAANSRISYPKDTVARTHYFRANFEIKAPAKYEKLKVRLTRWAGAAVFLNGQEILRHNLTSDATHNTPATKEEPSGPMRAYVFGIDSKHLKPGLNTMAVAVHRYHSMAHLYFELQLEGLLR